MLLIPLCRCLSYMRNLHPDVQCQALTEYANRRSKDTLNNPPAYFMSLLQVSFCCRLILLMMLFLSLHAAVQPDCHYSLA